MEVKIYSCSKCVGRNVEFIKYGKTSSGKQRYQCTNCKKTSVLKFTYNAYKQNTNEKIIQFTKEGLGIRSTARVLKISATTLLSRIIKIAKAIPRPVLSFGKIYEMDEIRFFVKKKKRTFWLAYAIDKETRKVAGFYIGRRTNRTLKAVIKTLLNSKPLKIFTDKLRNYQYLIPEKFHSTRRFSTNRIERKNLTIRTHLKRFSRKTICFSRSLVIISAILKIYFWW
ncbi:MAG: IS1 family transposase [Flavobacteriaceae bacterium]|jgi:IS1 family transposase/transposase-like protein|nr:IS1 family transposase [Flavobacteriaceae bacterium]